MPDKYEPTAEEITAAERMMTPTDQVNSEARENEVKGVQKSSGLDEHTFNEICVTFEMQDNSFKFCARGHQLVFDKADGKILVDGLLISQANQISQLWKKYAVVDVLSTMSLGYFQEYAKNKAVDDLLA